MLFLIDGYNLVRPARRLHLVSSLARLHDAEQDDAMVVFGRPVHPDLPDGRAFHGIRVHYARRGESSDDRVVELTRDNADVPDLCVVTSYYPLARRVAPYGVRTMDAQSLRHRFLRVEARAYASSLPFRLCASSAPCLPPRALVEAPRHYAFEERFRERDAIHHPKWGVGRVVVAGDTVIHVRFERGIVRRLAHRVATGAEQVAEAGA